LSSQAPIAQANTQIKAQCPSAKPQGKSPKWVFSYTTRQYNQLNIDVYKHQIYLSFATMWDNSHRSNIKMLHHLLEQLSAKWYDFNARVSAGEIESCAKFIGGVVGEDSMVVSFRLMSTLKMGSV